MNPQHFTLADGRSLAWRSHGSGPPLVLLHGWSSSGAVFGELAARLAARFQVILPDLPGHGHSSPCAEVSLESLAADIAAWLPQVASGPVVLGGWSLGGMVAMQLAHRHPEQVARLVLIGSSPRYTTSAEWPHGQPVTQVRALRRNIERRFEATLGDFLALAFAGETLDPARMRTIRDLAARTSPLPDRDTALALLDLLVAHDQRELLGGLDLPVLVVHGEVDRIIPFAAGAALAERLPESRLLEIKDVGHAPFLSRPDQVAAALEGFC